MLLVCGNTIFNAYMQMENLIANILLSIVPVLQMLVL